MLNRPLFCLFCVILCSATAFAAETARFKMYRIDTVRTEACGVADFNNDGKLDIVAGEYIYLAPDWKRIKIREVWEPMHLKSLSFVNRKISRMTFISRRFTITIIRVQT